MLGANPSEKAYLAPFAAFLGFLILGEIVGTLFEGSAHWAVDTPRYWIYPLQTIVCAAILARYWRHYGLTWPARPVWTTIIGLLVLVIWVSPQAFFGATPRVEGFEPHFFGADGWAYWSNLIARFVRLVIVVPLLEEIFWRGFLLRYLIREDFEKVPFGTFTWMSFIVVTVGFCLEHQFADYPAAILTGALYNLVAYKTRSLAACVLAHAVTNLGLGLYILATRQWGFW